MEAPLQQNRRFSVRAFQSGFKNKTGLSLVDEDLELELAVVLGCLRKGVAGNLVIFMCCDVHAESYGSLKSQIEHHKL